MSLMFLQDFTVNDDVIKINLIKLIQIFKQHVVHIVLIKD